MKTKTATRRPQVSAGTDNVLADIGLANPDERLAKAELVRQIAQVIAQAGWTQAQAAQRLGIDQPKVSALLRGQLAGFSTDRLIRFLNAIGQDVEIVISPRRPEETTASLRVIRRVA